MSSYVTPKINTEFIFYVGLFSQANTKVLQSNPTLASGDVRVSIDGGAFANLTTLPTATPASGKAVKVTLSASEMNGDNITVLFSDAAGDEWCDLVINIQTTAQQVDDLALASEMAIGFTESLLGLVLSSGKIGETGNDTTHIHLASLDYADDELNDYLLVIYDASDGDYYSRWIEDWVNSSGLATVAALPFTPQGGVDNYWLHAVRRDSGLTASEVNAEVDAALSDYDPPTKAELDTAQASIEADIATVQSDITAILTDTGTTIPAQISSLNNLSAAQVNSEVDTALSDIHLDHLFATDYDPANKPGVSTALLNELVESDGGVSRYTANALENAPSGGSGGATAAQVWAYGNRTLTSAVTSVETTVSSTEVSMYRGDTFGASMTGLGALGTWSKVYLTVKRNDSRDEESLVQLLVTNPAAAGDGLQRLNGRTATAAWGSLTIDDDSAGDITIALSANATKALEPGDYLFDIKYINSTGSHIKASGTWIVNQDITRAIA